MYLTTGTTPVSPILLPMAFVFETIRVENAFASSTVLPTTTNKSKHWSNMPVGREVNIILMAASI
jgi:hypothetical protein